MPLVEELQALDVFVVDWGESPGCDEQVLELLHHEDQALPRNHEEMRKPLSLPEGEGVALHCLDDSTKVNGLTDKRRETTPLEDVQTPRPLGLSQNGLSQMATEPKWLRAGTRARRPYPRGRHGTLPARVGSGS